MSRALVFVCTNALLFQVGWFVCVLSGNLWAASFTIVVLLIHFRFSSLPMVDVVSIFIALIIGLLHDFLLSYCGLIDFGGAGVLPPLWLMCLWILLGLTLNHSMGWIYQRMWLSGILGALAGPLSYWAGVALSPAQWSSPPVVVIPIMAATWLFILPLHRFASMRIEAYVRTKISSHP